MVSLGVVPEDYMGYEAAGIIVESNSSKYNIGDEVLIIKNKSGKAISIMSIVLKMKYIENQVT